MVSDLKHNSLIVEKGETYSFLYHVQDQNGDPIDLSVYSDIVWRAFVYKDSPVVNLSVSGGGLSIASTNELSGNVTSTTTSDISYESMYYEMEFVSSDGSKHMYLLGTLFVQDYVDDVDAESLAEFIIQIDQNTDDITITDPTTSALDASEEAHHWAEYPEDSAVPEGDGSEYSARHHRSKAETSETNAATSESNASTYESQAQTARDGAETAETNAQSYESDAQSHRDKAQQWAEENEDTEVEAGEYSAHHHANKASQSASSASTSESNAISAKDTAVSAKDTSVAAKDTSVSAKDETYNYAYAESQFTDENGTTHQSGVAPMHEDVEQKYNSIADGTLAVTELGTDENGADFAEFYPINPVAVATVDETIIIPWQSDITAETLEISNLNT